MGGTLDKIYNNTVYSLYLNSKAISVLQEQSSTGSRINRASDDPTSAYQVLGLQSQSRSLENYMDMIANISSTLEMTSTVLSSVGSVLSDIEVSLTQVISGTYTESGRDILVEEINDALEEITSLANTQNSSKYLFGGANTNSKPYTIEYDEDGAISSVTYTGSEDELSVNIAPGVSTTSYYVGNDFFSCDDRQTPTFSGETGAAAGSGTSSVTGTVWLEVTQDTDGDYCLSIGGDTVDLGSYTGDLSNVAVTDADGNVLYVDASNISSTGTNMVAVAGTYDIFNILVSVRDLIQNDDISDSQLQSFQNVLVDMLDDVYNHIVSQETAVGSRIGFLEDLNSTLDDINYNTEDQTTLLEEADVTQIAIDLARRETLYELTLSVAGQLLSMTLLDYID